jgi:hypothetical protein
MFTNSDSGCKTWKGIVEEPGPFNTFIAIKGRKGNEFP